MKGKLYRLLVFTVAGLWISPRVPAQESGLVQLTSGPTQDGFPSWSPDGRQLVFSRYGRDVVPEATGLWVISLDGAESRQLTPYIGEHPDWSPDGRYIAFDGEFGNTIQLTSADGGAPIRIVPESIPVVRGGQPKWSPDGSRIVFKGGPTLWLLDVATGRIDSLFSAEGKLSIPACWSPDGSRVFVYLRDAEGPNAAIWAVSVESGRHRKITPEEDGIYRYADVSPDGTLLAVVWCEGRRSCDIWAMPADGGRRVQITSHPDYEDGPAWSPDGTRIAFVSTRAGHFDIWTISVDIEQLRVEMAAAEL